MLNQYYLLLVGSKGKKLEHAGLLGLQPKELKDKQRSISWMKIGQGEHDDYRFAKRIGKTTFECVDTKEIFEITERIIYTVEAWERFLKEADPIQYSLSADVFTGLHTATLLGGEFANCHGQGTTAEGAIASLKIRVNQLRRL